MIEIEDTIVAIASPTSPAIRGIVRLSGPDVVSILEKMGLSLADRDLTHATRFDVDLDLSPVLRFVPISVMLWPDSRSYTGQPSAELHTYGSLPVLKACVDAAIDSGARAARPGEFTMRAFLAGRLDLTQAEAVLGVIEAEHRGSLDHALRQLAGNLSRPLEEMRASMLNLLADVEAGLDFVDEDIEFVSDHVLICRLTEILNQLTEVLETMKLRSGGASRPTIALRGDPNAGKSRLINCLANQEVSIVADVAGTTRDVVSMDALIGQRNVNLVDTAGIETAVPDDSLQDRITHQSQQHAERASADADIRIWCVDASREDFASAGCELREMVGHSRRSAADLWVATKIDLVPGKQVPSEWIATSAVSGEGIKQLVAAIDTELSRHDSEEVGSVVGTAARCRDTLARATSSVDAAIALAKNNGGHEFVAAELRHAVESLGEVTGAIYTDDLLDRVFSRFCIGK